MLKEVVRSGAKTWEPLTAPIPERANSMSVMPKKRPGWNRRAPRGWDGLADPKAYGRCYQKSYFSFGL